MKKENIIKNLEKRGLTVEFRRFGHWDNVPHVGKTAIAQHYCVNGTQGIRTEFKFLDVLLAIVGDWESVGEYLEYKQNL